MSVIRLSAPDLVVVSETIALPETMALLEFVKITQPSLPVVVLSDHPDVDLAVRLVRGGAYDVLRSPLDPRSLQRLTEGMRFETLRARSRTGRFFCENCPPGVTFVGQSPAAKSTLEMLRLVAESRCNPVLILGETGTGKELAARAVHAWRYGGGEQFVAVNCAALSVSLLESELFGHMRGSFTGADRDRVGLFEQAGDGSLFLDEISEMPPELQAKLLRVLQERTFRRVGGTCDIPCTATVIASSNRNLLEEVNHGRFRRDLYYRLAVFPVTLPPLRNSQRRQDIPLLAQYFLEHSQIRRDQAPTLGAAAAAKLMTHNWPGNVRELRNVIERAMILERSSEITPRSLHLDLPEPPEPTGSPVPLPKSGCSPSSAAAVVDFPVAMPPSARSAEESTAIDNTWPPVEVVDIADIADTASGPDGRQDGPVERVEPPSPFASGDFSLEAAEREFIRRALKETGWQRTRAAALLGITRATLHAKLKRYNIRPDEATLATMSPRDMAMLTAE